jgi:3-hydroxybutyryl-CoA dehydrogenase
LANRLQLALFVECLRCVEEGLATPDEIDAVVSSTFGFRLPVFGPFAIADMAGLDVYRGAYRVLEAGFEGRFVAPAALEKLVANGSYGAKTGSGFVIKSSAQAAAMAARRDRAYVALGRVLDGFEHDKDASDR